MLWRNYRSLRTKERLYNDKLTQLMEPYPKVPIWWNIALFVIPAAVLIALGATGKLYLPLYTVFIAFGFGALIASVLVCRFVRAADGRFRLCPWHTFTRCLGTKYLSGKPGDFICFASEYLSGTSMS